MDKRQYFEEIEVPDHPECLIYLDLDGTLLPDGQDIIDDRVQDKVAGLSKHHKIYISTNNKDLTRTERIASSLGVDFVHTHYKKHSRKVLGDLPAHGNRQVLVIGDKILTDGLLARRLNAHLYLVKRKYSGKENFLVRLSNYLDNIVASIFSLFI